MRFLARLVHRSFRKVEHFADWLTGAAGPVFVVLCLILVCIGVWTFFATMFPILAPTPPAVARLLSTKSPVHIIIGLGSALWQDSWLSLRWIIALFSCLWIVYSIAFHYYMAVKEAPGSVIDGLSDELRERRVGLGSDVWWSRHYDRVCKESITAARSQSQFSLLTNSVARKIEEITDEELIRVKEGEDLWVNVKVCHKCPRIPLWKAIACLPPELRRVEREIRSRKENGNRSQVESRNGSVGNGDGRRSTSPSDMDEWARGETVEEIQAWLGDETNKLVPVPKPERTHHCSVCDVCILKFDHHCPWLNQCVGIGNERYFVLFMVWLAIGCLVVVASGWRVVADSVSIYKPWRNAYTPRIFPLLTYALCALMGFGLSIMAVWQLLIVGWGETSVESSDNTHYREVCRRKGTKFSNVYDIGFVHNLLLFFNVSPLSNRSLWTILAPWRIEPYSDGWHFSKKLGGQGRHAGLAPEEELSDDEVERDDAHPMAN